MTVTIAGNVAGAGTGADAAYALPDGRRLGVHVHGETLVLRMDGGHLLRLRHRPAEEGRELILPADAPQPSADALWTACCWFFTHDPACRRLIWRGLDAAAGPFLSGLLVRDEDGTPASERAAFWQLPDPWTRARRSAGFPETWTLTGGTQHPRRPPKPSGEVYRRFDARLGAWISLRTVDIETDLERFNRWQNNPRVLEFWQEGGSLDHHLAYLRRQAEDPHCLTLIGCFDDEPFSYFEVYWAREDRIAPFYAVEDHDRGIHMLVGEEHHRGPHKVRSWLSALVHWAFLDDERTRTVVAEPRADNERMIGHMQSLGFVRERDFDFPHKRAALMSLTRRSFFERCPGIGGG
jgi:acetyl CoA:N6-hydroxylysine acetyl transferase